MGIINNIRRAARNRTTYRVGLLQAKAYRSLRQATDRRLKRFGISSNHWAFLGLVHDAGSQGIRSNAIAEELGVDASFITGLWKDLQRKGFVKRRVEAKDNRANAILLTPKGIAAVLSIEAFLRKGMRPIVKDIPARDLMAYLSVLERIIENAGNELN